MMFCCCCYEKVKNEHIMNETIICVWCVAKRKTTITYNNNITTTRKYEKEIVVGDLNLDLI